MDEAKLRSDLKALLIEANDLNRPDATDEQKVRWSAAIKQANGIKETLDRAKVQAELDAFAKTSAGMLPLTGASAKAYVPGGPNLEGFEPAGHMEVGRTQSLKGMSQLQVTYDEGPGALDEKTLAAISSRPYKVAFKAYLKLGRDNLGLDHLKVLQEGTDQQGGFLVPDDILARLVMRQPTPTRINPRVTQLQTSRDRLVMPKVNYTTDDIYTTGIRLTWGNEIPASSTSHRVTEPVFGTIGIPVYTAMLSMPITNDMVEDSMFPIVSWSADKFGETVEIAKDDLTLNGSGVGRPTGILVNPGGAGQPAVVNSGAAATLTGDGIKELSFALPEQYDDASVFLFNKTSAGKTLAELKDAEGRYLWSFGTQDGGLAQGWKNRPLLGYPVVLSALAPNVGANNYPIVFGDLSGYYMVNRVGFSVQVLRELYAETNQILLLGRLRLGGEVAEDWKLKIQKCSV